ncbi:MAG TPA: CZB domain-containing protein [Bryobacteraceae bacterium]|nr:CZB domain-containing protein [Bryobacteraceae bacterium]
MDFDSAIQAHTNWKLRLYNYCKGNSQDKIDVRTVQKDDICELGKWIHGEYRKHAGDPDFERLIEAHAAFHRSAAAAAALVELGLAPEAERVLRSPHSELSRRSLQVVGCLMSLKAKSEYALM